MINRLSHRAIALLIVCAAAAHGNLYACEGECAHPPAAADEADGAASAGAAVARPAKAIPDAEPEVTLQLRNALLQFADGSIAPDIFTDKARTALFPETARQIGQQMRGYGELRELQLLRRTVDGEHRLYRYRALYAKQAAIVDITFGKSGRIDVLAFRPE